MAICAQLNNLAGTSYHLVANITGVTQTYSTALYLCYCWPAIHRLLCYYTMHQTVCYESKNEQAKLFKFLCPQKNPPCSTVNWLDLTSLPDACCWSLSPPSQSYTCDLTKLPFTNLHPTLQAVIFYFTLSMDNFLSLSYYSQRYRHLLSIQAAFDPSQPANAAACKSTWIRLAKVRPMASDFSCWHLCLDTHADGLPLYYLIILPWYVAVTLSL